MKFFPSVEKASFVARPNRFLLTLDHGGERISAYLPNPGRLHELLLPGVPVYIEDGAPGRKTRYTAVAVEKEGHPVMLHTHRTNDVAHWLINEKLIPGLQGCSVRAREVAMGRSRFDFLLDKGGRELYLEVKSCTLFSGELAMFPDARTERGARHIRELADLSREGKESAVLFIIHSGSVRFFMPDYHTDLEFARTFIECRDHLSFIPLALGWSDELIPLLPPRLAEIPWELTEQEAKDRGSYLILLRLGRHLHYDEGLLKGITLEPGYYVYAGSAMASLSKRIERHRRLEKKPHWHIDHLRAHSEFIADFPVRASVPLECSLAEALGFLDARPVPSFGSSDCRCGSHLFRFSENPLTLPAFTALLNSFRMDRLIFQGRQGQEKREQ